MRALLPQPISDVDDQYLLQRYSAGQRPFVRFNFVSSMDGSAQADGLSEGLGSAGDRRIFSLLRRFADVVLVGSGTVKAEGYEGSLVSAEDIAWRTGHGLSPQPVLALVSRSLDMDPEAEVFTQTPVPILLFSTVAASAAQREAFGENVELIQVSRTAGGCDPQEIIEQLQQRGHGFIHCEGGPHIFGQFAAAGAVDSACISYSPVLVAGEGLRIAVHERSTFQKYALHTLLEEDGMLFCDYRLKESAESPQE